MKKLVLVTTGVILMITGVLFSDVNVISNSETLTAEIYNEFELTDHDINADSTEIVTTVTLIPDGLNVAALDYLVVYIDNQEVQTNIYQNGIDQNVVISFYNDEFVIGVQIRNLKIFATSFEIANFNFSILSIGLENETIEFNPVVSGNNIVITEDITPPLILSYGVSQPSSTPGLVTIDWESNEFCQGTLQIPEIMYVSANFNYLSYGEFTVDNLEPDHTYQFIITTTDRAGNPTSITEEFTTLENCFNPSEDIHNLSVYPEQDVLYVYPLQYMGFDYSITRNYDNSLENTMIGFNFELNNGFAPYSNVGYYYYNPYVGNIYYSYANELFHILWNSNSPTGIDGSSLMSLWTDNEIPIGEAVNLFSVLDTYDYHPDYGYFGGYISQYHTNTKTIISNSGIRGDVNGDGIVNYADYQMLIDYMLDGTFANTRYNSEGQINIWRGSVFFSSPCMFNVWLLNVWLNDPDDPLVVGLGIGQAFDFENDNLPVNWILEGNIITINTDGNAVEIYGTIDDEYCHIEIVDNGVETKTWIDNEEIKNISSRGEFEISLPTGFEVLWVKARNLNNPTSTEPNNIPEVKNQLHGNYPNPFNPSTTISFNITESNNVELEIYNVKGQIVQTLVDERLEAGSHQVFWNGKDQNNKSVTSGVYFYKMKCGSYTSTKKMILMK
jgi:type IX secretion system substrate protein/dockerin type I repeat protein